MKERAVRMADKGILTLLNLGAGTEVGFVEKVLGENEKGRIEFEAWFPKSGEIQILTHPGDSEIDYPYEGLRIRVGNRIPLWLLE